MLDVAIGDVYLVRHSGMTFIVTDIEEGSLFARVITYYALSGVTNVTLSGPHKDSLLVSDTFLQSAIIVSRRGDDRS
jgi:hypothetical protein